MIYAKLKEYVPQATKRNLKRWWLQVGDTCRYRLSRSHKDLSDIHKIVFVCKGNICRSAYAEFYAKKVLPDTSLEIESCGIDVDQGLYSPATAIEAAKSRGVDLSKHRSKGLMHCDIERANLILAMEYRQFQVLQEQYPQKQGNIYLLRDYATGPQGFVCNIYDPFGLDGDEFTRCFKLVELAVNGLLKQSQP